MFKATKLLNHKTSENPKAEDSEGKVNTRPGYILDIDLICKYFKDKSVDSDQAAIPPSQVAARPLRKK